MIRLVDNIPNQYKSVKLPTGLIFHAPKTDEYHLIDTKTGRILGKMRANISKDVENLYKKGKKTSVFYINYLRIREHAQRQGWGKYLIDFAKNKSLETKCEGRISLYAFNVVEAPHLFYRKLGFASRSKIKNKKMDQYIENKKPYTSWMGLKMYLPIENIQKS